MVISVDLNMLEIYQTLFKIMLVLQWCYFTRYASGTG
jgi:hypothetical protein